jgi:hypothetical protein
MKIMLIVLLLVNSVGAQTLSIDHDHEEVECAAEHPNSQVAVIKKIHNKLERVSNKNKVNCSKKDRGAWFYKVATMESSKQDIGIQVIGKLPDIKLDPKRNFDKKGHFTDGPLDRPSVYLGGKVGGQEVDAGLTWDKVYDSNGVAKKGEDNKDLFAFRPFWRSAKWNNPNKNHSDEKDPKGCAEKHRQDLPKECSLKNIYFSPGEEIEMSLKQIQAKGEKMKIRMVIKNKTDPSKCLIVCFDHTGIKSNGSTWKRVNSIDQFKSEPCENDPKQMCRKGNERKPGEDPKNVKVLSTESTAMDARWESVKILHSNGKSEALKPKVNAQVLVGGEFCNDENLRQKSFRDGEIDDKGGQKLSISPSLPPVP